MWKRKSLQKPKRVFALRAKKGTRIARLTSISCPPKKDTHKRLLRSLLQVKKIIPGRFSFVNGFLEKIKNSFLRLVAQANF